MAVVDSNSANSMLAEVLAGRAPPLEPLTLDQVERMIEHGILRDGAPFELMDGVLIRKDRGARGDDPMTHNPAHALCVKRLMALLSFVQSLGLHLQCQLPIALLPTRAPEPDVAVIRGEPDDYSGRHPGPNDVVAVFEVADSSLEYDRAKQNAYALAGIPIYWIANLIDDVVEVYQRPNIRTGKYDSHIDYRLGEVIDLSLSPNSLVTIRVDQVVGRVKA
jgi:Uma2 family endonuclease